MSFHPFSPILASNTIYDVLSSYTSLLQSPSCVDLPQMFNFLCSIFLYFLRSFPNMSMIKSIRQQNTGIVIHFEHFYLDFHHFIYLLLFRLAALYPWLEQFGPAHLCCGLPVLCLSHSPFIHGLNDMSCPSPFQGSNFGFYILYFNLLPYLCIWV